MNFHRWIKINNSNTDNNESAVEESRSTLVGRVQVDRWNLKRCNQIDISTKQIFVHLYPHTCDSWAIFLCAPLFALLLPWIPFTDFLNDCCLWKFYYPRPGTFNLTRESIPVWVSLGNKNANEGVTNSACTLLANMAAWIQTCQS